MNTFEAFARGKANAGRIPRVFDWIKAATILKERGIKEAQAGLAGDFEWTGGTILEDGKPVPEEDCYCYLASTWAIPMLVLDDEEIDCWKYASETPGWGAGTVWPPEALAIWNGEGQTLEGTCEEVKETLALPTLQSKEGD